MSIDLAALYGRGRLSSLHRELETFAADVVTTPEDRDFCEELVTIVDSCTADVVGRRAKVAVFGSHAMGLSTHASDLDLVILNVIRVKGNGFTASQRARAIQILYTIGKRLDASRAFDLESMNVSIASVYQNAR